MLNPKAPEIAATHPTSLARLVDIARVSGPRVTMATALRTRSITYRYVLAELATEGEMSYEEIASGRLPSTAHPEWLAALARVVALQARASNDTELGIKLLELVMPVLEGRSALWASSLLTQLYLATDDFERAAQTLDSRPQLESLEWGYLRTDLLNPFTGSPFADLDTWWLRFGRFFTDFGYPAPMFTDEAGSPFDRVRSPHGLPRVTDGPLVSVVMTTFRPEPDELRTSVVSMLEQTWRNLEIVIIDDHSPESFLPLLAEMVSLDPRVRLFRLPQNGGTYLARNAGLRRAVGEYVTGQDADDWSHPMRLEAQIAPLLAGHLAGTRVRSVTTDDRLVATRPGFTATRPNPSTLMLRRDDAIRLGGFLPSRKAADSEFHHRAEVSIGKPVETVGEGPLTIVRVRNGSLSRSDFLPGWSHPSRRAFVDSYRHWHRTTAPAELRSDETAADRALPLPRRFIVSEDVAEDLDVMWVGDYRAHAPYASRLVEELRALTAAGLRVGALHLEDARLPASRKEPINPQLLALVSSRQVCQVLEDDDTKIKLTVVRRPWLLSTPPGTVTLKTDRLVVCADATITEDEIATVTEVAEGLFRAPVAWSGINTTTHERLGARGLSMTAAPIHDVVAPRTRPEYPQSSPISPPVVGREVADLAWASFCASEEHEDALPTDGSADIRLLHLASRPAKHAPRPHPRWTVMSRDAIDLQDFLCSLDFYVLTEGDVAPLDSTGLLEALAAGRVAVVPPRWRDDLGDAVAYATTSFRGTMTMLHTDRAAYARQSRRAVDYITREHSPRSLPQNVISLLSVASGAPRAD